MFLCPDNGLCTVRCEGKSAVNSFSVTFSLSIGNTCSFLRIRFPVRCEIRGSHCQKNVLPESLPNSYLVGRNVFNVYSLVIAGPALVPVAPMADISLSYSFGMEYLEASRDMLSMR